MSIRTLAGDEKAAVRIDADAPPPQTGFMDLLARRGTVRAFRQEPVPDTWVDAIIAHGMRAPTSSNMQAYSVVVVKDAAIKSRLAEISGNQRHIVECPVFFAVCADLTRLEHACALHGLEYEGRSLESGLVASLDAALLGITMSYVAESMGLANVLIGALRNDALEVAKVLRLPQRCYAVFGMCVGWALNSPVPKPRTPLYGVVHRDTYNANASAQAIAQYDRDLAGYYRQKGVTTPDAAWTRVLAERLARDVRRGLRGQLRQLGFPME